MSTSFIVLTILTESKTSTVSSHSNFTGFSQVQSEGKPSEMVEGNDPEATVQLHVLLLPSSFCDVVRTRFGYFQLSLLQRVLLFTVAEFGR